MLEAPPPPAVEVNQTAEEGDIIEVVGTRSDQTQKIDRRTFRVQQNAQSAQKDAGQLLRGLPAVTVSADEQVMLLGSGNVRIFVDGRPYPGDVAQFLRTVHGSDIASIDVITNPSAQYSAEGTGGIINFNLRAKRNDGASGNIVAEGSSLGRARFDGTYKARDGAWSFELETHGAKGRGGRSDYFRRRVETQSDASAIESIEDGRFSKRDELAQIVGKATRELDSKTVISTKLDAARYRSVTMREAQFDDLFPDPGTVEGRWRTRHSSSTVVGEINLDHKGRNDGESLKATIRAYAKPRTIERNRTDLETDARVDAERRQSLVGVYGQVDWQRPVGRNNVLSIGSSWNYRRLDEDYAYVANLLGAPQVFDDFSAENQTAAAYATFQFAVAGWKVMPGVRIEHDGRRISFPGTLTVTVNRINLFPTMHVEHRLNQRLNLTLSYSRRIDRAPAELLRPYLIFEDIITGAQGNPYLKDQFTDAYELGLHFNRGKLDANLTMYDRETRHVWSRDYRVIDGINVYSWLNSGSSRSIGAQLDLSTPITKTLRSTVSFNLFRERLPIELSDPLKYDSRARYSVNGSLEWRGPDRGKIAGDVVELRVIHNSASREFQIRNAATNWLSASYTHSFSPSLSITMTGDYSSTTRRFIDAPLVREESSDRKPIEIRLKLLKRLGEL